MTAKTSTERAVALRARRAAEGQQEVRGIYLPPELHAQLKALARQLAKTIPAK